MGQDNEVLYDVSELKERVRTLEQNGQFRTALDQLFPVLDKNPNDEVALQLANIVLYAGSSSSQAYNAKEPLTEDYILDARLDPLFCQCNQCGVNWTPTPFASMFDKVIISDPSGGFCARCNKVFCKKCSSAYAQDYKCPECSSRLKPIKKPNGRTSLQMRRRKEKPKLVIVFREGPVPPDGEYLTKWLRRLSPDTLDESVKIKAEPIFPWPDDKMALLNEVLAICAVSQIGIPASEDIDDYFAVDEEGNNFCLIKIYEKVDSKNLTSTCWYCKQSPARSGSEVTVYMHKLIKNKIQFSGRQIEYESTSFKIPRCSRCHHLQSKAETWGGFALLIGVGSMLIGFPLAICALVQGPGSEMLWTGVGVVAVIGVLGFAFGNVMEEVAHKRLGVKSKSYALQIPTSKKMFSEGWKLGDKPGSSGNDLPVRKIEG